MMRPVAPILIVAAFLAASVTSAFAMDGASAEVARQHMAANATPSQAANVPAAPATSAIEPANETITPKPVKKKLHRDLIQKHAAAAKKKKATPAVASGGTAKVD